MKNLQNLVKYPPKHQRCESGRLQLFINLLKLHILYFYQKLYFKFIFYVYQFACHIYLHSMIQGPLLDVGRNPLMFPCSWLYRQGVLSPWARNRRPVLDGDNWWRGHAAAFLKYANLPPEALRHGRVNQVKCEAAYFIVVLHHLQTVVIAIRGTETPEDLITDGLCKECTLSAEDLAGLINCNHIHSDIHKNVASSFPHYGHSGIVEAARELYMQIEGNPGEHGTKCLQTLNPMGFFLNYWDLDVNALDIMSASLDIHLGGL